MPSCRVEHQAGFDNQQEDKPKNQRIRIGGKTYRDILVKDGVVSVELIKNRLQGIATNPTTLLAMSWAELQTVKESVGRSRAEGTYLNLFYSDRNLREFVENKGVQDISIGTLQRTCSRNTVSSQKAWTESIHHQQQPLLAEPTDVPCGQQEDYPLQSVENTKYEKRKRRYAFCKRAM